MSPTGATGASLTTWTYDNDSRVVQQVDPAEKLNFVYDAGGRLTQKTWDSTQNWYYGYDNDNRLTSVKYPGSHGAYSYLAYNTDGTLHTKTADSGAVTTYSYDSAAQTTGISTSNTATQVLSTLSYAYDDAGNNTYRSQWCPAGAYGDNGADYRGFDGAGMMDFESHADAYSYYPLAHTFVYTYDHNENRLSKSWGNGSVDVYAYDANNKMTGAGADTFGYDGNGNMTSVTNSGTLQWSYAYDYEDRLIWAQKPGVAADQAAYTGMGGRYFVMDSTGGRWQYNDGEDATSSLLTDNTEYFSAGLGQTVGGMSGSDVSYMTDALGSTLGLTDPGQATKESDVYDGFGNVMARSSNFTFGYGESVLYGGAQGYQTDNDTGLVRCGNRYYNPYFGRFITQDPEGDGDNWYAYCGNDPVDGSDPDGLDSIYEGRQISDSDAIKKAIAAGLQPGDAFKVTISGPLSGGGWGPIKTYTLTVPQANYGEGTSPTLLSVATPNGIPPGWVQIPHGPDGTGGPSGETRWINPEGTAGLEHHPAKDSGGGHQEQEHVHPLEKTDGKWKFTNPKKTIVLGVGVIATVRMGIIVWETAKWIGAIVVAPETGGGSVAAALAIP